MSTPRLTTHDVAQTRKPASPDTTRRLSALPDGFDVEAWTRAACDASGVPFAVEDPLALLKLRDLAKHPA